MPAPRFRSNHATALRSVRDRGNLVPVRSRILQDEVIGQPLARVLPRDGVPDSFGFTPRLGILDADPDQLGSLAVDQVAGADDGVGLTARHEPVLHDPLVRARNLESVLVQRDHGDGDVAAEERQARGATNDDVRAARDPAAPERGEGLQHGGHAHAANFRVVDGQLGEDGLAADGGDDGVDELAVVGL